MKANKIYEENVNNFTFEEALKELEEIVEQLESGEITLDGAVSAYEKGSKLKNVCQKHLNEARIKVEKIKEDEKGQISTEEFDI